MRNLGGSRLLIAAVILFSTLYWILKVEKRNLLSDATWTSKFNGGAALSAEYVALKYPTAVQEPLPEVISKKRPQQTLLLSAEFPKLIWQTSDAEGAERWSNMTATWMDMNPAWEYNLLTDEGATAFVYENFRHRPSVVQFWSELQQVVLKADLIRYLAMLARGGVYSDIDTSSLQPIDNWIPDELREKKINAVVGIEYDDTTYKMFVRPISFCQWTLMARPGHALFERAVLRVMSNLEYMARRKRVTLRELELNKMEVLEATGPGMFTDVVMEVLRDQVEHIRWDSFHNRKKPMLFGDVLVLPVRGFAGGQKHSHSKDKAYGEELVHHWFGRSWYTFRPSTPLEMPPDDDDKVEENLKTGESSNTTNAIQHDLAETVRLEDKKQPTETIQAAEQVTKGAAQEKTPVEGAHGDQSNEEPPTKEISLDRTMADVEEVVDEADADGDREEQHVHRNTLNVEEGGDDDSKEIAAESSDSDRSMLNIEEINDGTRKRLG